MKKYDKEYSTQYTPEMLYLADNGIQPTFVKVVNEVTTYKYTKTAELFALLTVFYDKDNKGDNDEKILDRRGNAIHCR